MEYLGENLLHGIACTMEKFTNSESELAKYIIENPDEISLLSINQIAKKFTFPRQPSHVFVKRSPFQVLMNLNTN